MDELKKIVSSDEIVDPNAPNYRDETLPWAAQKDAKPNLVVRPKTVESLSKILKVLSSSSLDFAIRSGGYGSSSAKDVLISMTAFDQFEFDRENEVVTVGVGQGWGEFFRKMEEVAPGYAAVACRTPSVGVGGSTLAGGLSWLSSEYGLVSDPENLLDARIVKLDGSIVWASEEPDLLWAIRGAGPSFGAVTAFKLRAYRYPSKVYSGVMMYPRSSLRELIKEVAAFDARNKDPKLSVFVNLVQKQWLAAMGIEQDMVIMYVYDGNGEEHGRSDEGLGWAFKIPGAMDQTGMMTQRQIADLAAPVGYRKGQTNSYFVCVAISELSETILQKCYDWYERVEQAGGSIAPASLFGFELMLNKFDGDIPPEVTAWPHPKGFRHMLLLGTGCALNAPAEEDVKARKLLQEVTSFVFGETQSEVRFFPSGMQEFQDSFMVYGDNYPKLQKVKQVYDPNNRLKGPISVH